MLLVVAGAAWFVWQQPPVRTENSTAGARKVHYYQCAMHPWIKSDKPGNCSICGMKLVPVYEEDSSPGTNAAPGTVKLNAERASVINVQTDVVAARPLTHVLHFAGTIQRNSPTSAWFVFNVYERDLPWIKIGQTLRVSVLSAPEKRFDAEIKLHGTQPFADRDFDEMSASTKMRAEILNPPVEVGDFGNKLFNNLHAEAHLIALTAEVLSIPRSAVISRGMGAVVYVEKGEGRYEPRAVLLGRVGDDFYEVRAGLEAGEKVVTTGNVLIDSEAQLTANH